MASGVKTKSIGDGKSVVYFLGRIDVSTANNIEETIEKFIASENISSMLINLEGVEYLSSSGFRVLIAIMRKLQSSGGSLKICSLKSDIKKMFDVIEMTPLFDIFETENEGISQL